MKKGHFVRSSCEIGREALRRLDRVCLADSCEKIKSIRSLLGG